MFAAGCAQPVEKPILGSQGDDTDSNDSTGKKPKPKPIPVDPDPLEPIPDEPDPEPKPEIKPISDPVPTPDPKPIPEPEPTPKPEDEVKDPGNEGDGRFILKPVRASSPRFDHDPNTKASTDPKVKKGRFEKFTMSSKDSKIFTGFDPYIKVKQEGDFTRDGWVYIPADYQGEELPVIFIGDGSWGQHRLLVPTLDNLIHAKKVPRMAAVFLQPGPLGGGDGPNSQRSLEYDSVDDRFARFVETEVFPKVEKDFKIKFTKNPEGRATMGGSSSGSMAFTMAWFRPDLFRRVLTYSGTFVNRKPTGEIAKGAWEYHSERNLIGQSVKKPLRITLQVSQKDNNFNNGDNDWVRANENMYKVLKDKGYHVRFHYAEDVGHINHDVYANTLPENLIWLWAGYPIK